MATKLTRVQVCRAVFVAGSCVLLLACLARAEEGVGREGVDLKDGPLAKLADTYGLEIVCADESFSKPVTAGRPKCDPPLTADLLTFVPLFAREFSLYPVEFVRKAKLSRVVLCTNLSVREGGAAALADCALGTMYIDVSLARPESARYACIAVHHELFHQVDFADDGDIIDDPGWLSLNPAEFVYCQLIANDLAPHSSEFSETSPGFVTRYCLTALAEDKAEVFAHLIVDGAYMDARAKADPLLNAKITTMKRPIAAFCPEMGSDFWASAQGVKRPGSEPTFVPLSDSLKKCEVPHGCS